MSLPGWYPDPAGTPGRFRYWDGRSWSQQTTSDPAHAPAPGAPVGPPPQPGSQPLGGQSGSRPLGSQPLGSQPLGSQPLGSQPLGGSPGAPVPPQQKQGGRGTLFAVLAALLVLALVVWALVGQGSSSTRTVPEDTNSASPTGPVWNEKDSPTPSPSGTERAPSHAAMVACPTGGSTGANPAQGGQLRGGGLVAPEIPGWDSASTFALPWTQDLAAQTKTIVTYNNGTGAWFSVSAVGALPKGEGFTDPRTSAEQMMSCFATSSYYTDYTGRKDVVSEAVTVSGHKGWHLRSEVTVDMPELPQVEGDVIDVVVVDTGSATTLGSYVSSATIGDSQTQAEVDGARKGLTVG